jgi:hypothetical protein
MTPVFFAPQNVRVIASLCLVFFCVGWCFGQGKTATHLPGGSDWKSLSSAERKLYLSGWVLGYRLGTLHAGVLATSNLAPEKVNALTPAQKKDYDESLGWAHRVTPILLHGASGLEATVSTFYGDYRNTTVCLDEAILFSAATLAGNAASDQELGAARKQGAASGCK